MSMSLTAGQLLDQGRYIVEERIGSGGMAAVYRARDTELERTVAVKTMSAALAAEESGRERFRREARAVARLSHPNVVAVFDVREEPLPGGPLSYLVMEYVDGQTLAASMPAGPGAGAGDLDRTLRVTGEILDALAASHAQGMVHRDIKPANVMVCPDGSVKVMDFGIAHALETPGTALTRTGTAIGTPHYMSPEQFEGQRGLDGRSDLYSLGVVLFELLTGEVPFDADSGFQVGYQHVTKPPPTLGERGARVPAAVEALVARALAKDPADRFADAEAMRAEVRRLREGGTGPVGAAHGAAASPEAETRPVPAPNPTRAYGGGTGGQPQPPPQWSGQPVAPAYQPPTPTRTASKLGRWARRLVRAYVLLLTSGLCTLVYVNRSEVEGLTIPALGAVGCAVAGIWVAAGVLGRARALQRFAALLALAGNGYLLLGVLNEMVARAN
ncbi:protein kinase [Streptomyces sp. NPDC050418]|uniref:protein kinase domain-containing protein n=1 Tax=Streptomyces sp. NPDC050418 TaxID=3365612 RepID=UPI00378CCD33